MSSQSSWACALDAVNTAYVARIQRSRGHGFLQGQAACGSAARAHLRCAVGDGRVGQRHAAAYVCVDATARAQVGNRFY